MSDSSVEAAIKAIEELMDEEEGRAQGNDVVMFQVFVDQTKVGGIAPFFLDTDAANNYYNDLVRRIEEQFSR